MRAIVEGMWCIRPPSVTRKKTNLDWIDDDDDLNNCTKSLAVMIYDELLLLKTPAKALLVLG